MFFFAIIICFHVILGIVVRTLTYGVPKVQSSKVEHHTGVWDLYYSVDHLHLTLLQRTRKSGLPANHKLTGGRVSSASNRRKKKTNNETKVRVLQLFFCVLRYRLNFNLCLSLTLDRVIN